MFRRFIKSFYYALSGIAYAIKTQRNMKIHTLALVVVLAVGFWVELSRLEWAIVLIMAGIVIICEMLNTAIEALVDLETKEYHSLAKIAKDVAAGAVLIASILSVVVGLLIFVPKILDKLNIF